MGAFVNRLFCASLFLASVSSHSMGRDYGSIDVYMPDSWTSYYDRFEKDHRECSTVTGVLFIQPSEVKVLAFFDGTQLNPMRLTPSVSGLDEVQLGNINCRLSIRFSRTLDWSRESGYNPATLEFNKNIEPTLANPEMKMRVLYSYSNESCSNFFIPFALNGNNLTLTQNNSFQAGYQISSRTKPGGEAIIHHFTKPGCDIEMEVSATVFVENQWAMLHFRH